MGGVSGDTTLCWDLISTPVDLLTPWRSKPGLPQLGAWIFQIFGPPRSGCLYVFAVMSSNQLCSSSWISKPGEGLTLKTSFRIFCLRYFHYLENSPNTGHMNVLTTWKSFGLKPALFKLACSHLLLLFYWGIATFYSTLLPLPVTALCSWHKLASPHPPCIGVMWARTRAANNIALECH